MSHFSQRLSMLSLVENLMLLPKKPFFDKKNNVAGLDFPSSSKPTNVKLCS